MSTLTQLHKSSIRGTSFAVNYMLCIIVASVVILIMLILICCLMCLEPRKRGLQLPEDTDDEEEKD